MGLQYVPRPSLANIYQRLFGDATIDGLESLSAC